MPFIPTDLSSIWGWWKGDAGVTQGGGTVTAWADQSGNGRNMTIPGIYGTPTYVASAINSLPAIASMSGSQALATSVNLPIVTEATLWIVGKQDDTEGAFAMFAYASSGIKAYRYNTADKIAGDSATGSPVTGPNINATDDTYYTIRVRVTATNVYLSLNNGAEVTVVQNAGALAALTPNPFTLFTDGSHDGKKHIAEVILYTGNKTGNDSDLVEYYLQQKYNHFTWSGSVPTAITTTMAKIPGKDVKLEISTDTGTTWKALICEISNTANFTRNTTVAPLTKCDTASAAQEITLLGYEWGFDFEALTDTAPSSTQVTYADVKTLAINGTSFLVRRQYDGTGSEFYESGTGYITSLTSPATVDGFHSFSGTIKGSGAQDITP